MHASLVTNYEPTPPGNSLDEILKDIEYFIKSFGKDVSLKFKFSERLKRKIHLLNFAYQ